MLTSATCVDKDRLRYWKTKVDDTQNKKVSLAALQLSGRPHNMMLKKLALKFRRKRQHVGSEINKTTAKNTRNVDPLYLVQNVLYATIRNALVQHAVKNHF